MKVGISPAETARRFVLLCTKIPSCHSDSFDSCAPNRVSLRVCMHLHSEPSDFLARWYSQACYTGFMHEGSLYSAHDPNTACPNVSASLSGLIST